MEEGNKLQRLVDGIEQIFLECSGEQKPPEEIIHRLEQIKLQWKETCEPHEIGRPEYLITEYMHVNRIMQNDIFLRYAVEATAVALNLRCGTQSVLFANVSWRCSSTWDHCPMSAYETRSNGSDTGATQLNDGWC